MSKWIDFYNRVIFFHGLIIIHWPTERGEYFLFDLCACNHFFGSLEDMATYAIIFKHATGFPTEMSVAKQLEIFRRIYNYNPEIAKEFFFYVAYNENIPLLSKISEIYPEFLPKFCGSHLMTLILNNKNKSFPIMIQKVKDFYDIYNFYSSKTAWIPGLVELGRVLSLDQHEYIKNFMERAQLL